MKTILYRHFNATDDLLYIGISVSVFDRVRAHRRGSHWFDEITLVTMERFNSREDALRAERAAIKNEKPKYNTVYNEAPNEELFPNEELGIEPRPEPISYLGRALGGPLEGLSLRSGSDHTFMMDKDWNIHIYSWKIDHWEYGA